jgi:hypothetical protein
VAWVASVVGEASREQIMERARLASASLWNTSLSMPSVCGGTCMRCTHSEHVTVPLIHDMVLLKIAVSWHRKQLDGLSAEHPQLPVWMQPDRVLQKDITSDVLVSVCRHVFAV